MVQSEWRQWSDEYRVKWETDAEEGWVAYSRFGPVVELPSGRWAPVRATYARRDGAGDGPYTVVEIEFVGPGDVQPVVTAVHVMRRDGGREVLAVDLAGIRLADIVEHTLRLVTRDPVRVSAEADTDPGMDGPPDRPGLDQEIRSERKSVRRRRPYDSDLAEVARVYREAHSDGRHPTKAVREHLGLPESTARRWVARAEERGFDLGPGRQRRKAHGRRRQGD